jgi:hypothetical protein
LHMTVRFADTVASMSMPIFRILRLDSASLMNCSKGLRLGYYVAAKVSCPCKICDSF